MFDWNHGNAEHIALHFVSIEEVEEALLDPRRIGIPAFSTQDEVRYCAIGSTEDGRVLVVVFTNRHGMIRAISARDATRRERRRYGRR